MLIGIAIMKWEKCCFSLDPKKIMFRNIHIWLGSYLKRLNLKWQEGWNKGA